MHLECFGFDCMTRHRRNQLTRELWRLRASIALATGPCHDRTAGDRQQHASTTTTRHNHNTTSTSQSSQHDMKLKSNLNSILKRLNVEELELLLESVKSKGRAHNHCVYLSVASSHHKPTQSDKSTVSVSQTVTGGLLAESRTLCQAWRWPDLADSITLKQLPNCQIPVTTYCSSQSAVVNDHCKPTLESRRVCINPYHWSKVFYLADIKPSNPVTSELDCDGVVNKKLCDLTKTDSSGNDSPSEHWCQVAYWELSKRIGQLLPVMPSSIDVFQSIAQGCGLSLDALHKSHTAKTAAVSAVRAKIGLGITLSHEGDLVWLYNRSLRDVFISSYYLNLDHANSAWRIHKVLAGHCVVIYDYSVMSRHSVSTECVADGPSDPHSILLSFVKGWSGSYSRQSVLSCECWLELLINKHKHSSR